VTPLAQTLIGRGAELELLDRTLDEACAGSFRFLLVAGEPGIGKTSLLAELARRAEDRDCLVLKGSAAELEQDLPFGLLVDALDAYLASLDPRTYERLAADELVELGSVFPSLRALGPVAGSRPSTAAERFRAHHAVRELLERLAARQPLVMALDDVHWSDGASLELIAHLLRRRPEGAVMVAAGLRTGQARGSADAVEAAIAGGEVERIVLGPLDSADAGRLVTAGDQADRDRLYRESGGNPFYLLQLARADPGGGPAAVADGWGAAGVPEAVTAAITRELAALPDHVRGFAQAASVVGDPFDLDVAVATAAMPEPEALEALDELVARELLRPADVPRRFRFRHPLVRSAVYASCSPGARLTAHERAARALAERGAPATTRAHHVEQSARHGDIDAVAVLLEAGQSAAQRAPSSAARWFEAALRILPDGAPSLERAGLLMALARAQAATGRLEPSRAALLETIELLPPDEPLLRVRLISACAALEQLLGRHREAHARLHDALEGLADRESPEGVSLMIDIAWDAGLDSDYERMHEWSDAALEAARPLADGPLKATAAALAALAHAWTGPIDRAEELHAEAAGLAGSLPDDVLAARPHALQWLSAGSFFLDRYEEGVGHARRGLELARASGQGELVPGLAQALAVELIVTGRLAEAVELLDGAIDAARLTDNAVSLTWALGSRCLAALMEGDVDTATAMGDETAVLMRGFEDQFVKGRASGAIGAVRLMAGDPERAAEVLVSGTGGEQMPLIPGGWKVFSLEALVRARLALGLREDAERTAAYAQDVAADFGLPYARSLADRASASVALAAGDAETAAKLALASADRAEEIGARVDAALSRILAGRALAAGDADRAAAQLERAAEELEACGAARHRDEAEHELRKLGRTVHRRSRRGSSDGAGIEVLTGRELEVARLVVDRRTNPEIAAELFLSIKTVETHMRNIFRKLDAGSRVEVARIVERAQVPQ
jgi:ATP/maltotriose-dependent transcriptional regulator MalT